MASSDDDYDGSSTESEYYEGVDYEALGCVVVEGVDVTHDAEDAAAVDSSANVEAKGSDQSSPRSAMSLHDAKTSDSKPRGFEPAIVFAVQASKPQAMPVNHEPEPEARPLCQASGLSISQSPDGDHNDSAEASTPAARTTGGNARRSALRRKRRKIICTSLYTARKRRIKRTMKDLPSSA